MVSTFWQTFWSCYQWLSAQHEDNLGNQPFCSNHVVDFAAFIFCLHPTCYPSQLAFGKWRVGSWWLLMVPDHPDVIGGCNGWIWTKQRWFFLAPNSFETKTYPILSTPFLFFKKSIPWLSHVSFQNHVFEVEKTQRQKNLPAIHLQKKKHGLNLETIGQTSAQTVPPQSSIWTEDVWLV